MLISLLNFISLSLYMDAIFSKSHLIAWIFNSFVQNKSKIVFDMHPCNWRDIKNYEVGDARLTTRDQRERSIYLLTISLTSVASYDRAQFHMKPLSHQVNLIKCSFLPCHTLWIKERQRRLGSEKRDKENRDRAREKKSVFPVACHLL